MDDTRINSIIQNEVNLFGSSPASHQSLSPDFITLLDEAHRHARSGYIANNIKNTAHSWIITHQISSLYNSINTITQENIQNHATAFVEALDHIASSIQSLRHLLQSTYHHIHSLGIQLGSPDHLILESIQHKFSLSVTASICRMAPVNLATAVHDLYALGLPSITSDDNNDDHDENRDLNNDELINSNTSRTATAVINPHLLAHASSSLSILGLSELVIKVASSVVKSHIKQYLQHACDSIDIINDDDNGHSVLKQGLKYIETTPLEYLKIVCIPQTTPSSTTIPTIDNSNNNNSMTEATVQKWTTKLQSFVYEELGMLHTTALFNLVIDYPDSLPTLSDLRECLQYTKSYAQLVDVFGAAIKTRLLHPGAATTDILQHYISTIRALQHIDPSGAVLDAVSMPLREYLRTRKDAIRCIITLLTEDGDDSQNASFLAELAAAANDEAGTGGDDGEDFCKPDADEKALIEATKWEPGPLAVAPLQISSGAPHSMDVISLLVNIYGTKELFVSEYKSMLADRLLAKTDFDADRDIRTLELLKLRFGEATLHAAEVMLRDMADSKRINANVRTISNRATPLKKVRHSLVPLEGLGVTIVSQLFWPSMQHEEFALPKEVHAMLDTFAHKYHAIKAPRVLQWKPSLGNVELSLTIGSKTLDFCVSPMLATLILCFQKHPEWTVDELADELNVSTDVVRKKMLYWSNQGIISIENKQHNGISVIVYKRNEELQKGPGMHDGDAAGAAMDDGDNEEGQDADMMSRFEPFVLGMLTNFDSLPLDRIHNMLKMFATDPPYDRTMEQLSSFMSKLSTEDKVVLEGGMYKRRG